MISQELREALKKAKEKHPRVCFEEHSVRSFIGKMTELKDEHPFGEALRYSLNYMNIWNKPTRTAYASLAGTYFGRRGGRQTARGNPSKKPKVTQNKQKDKINKHGQHEFEM